MTQKKRPNIVFIVLDTQRVDRLSCYGHTVNTSPSLDKLAEEGTLYEQAISPAQWTIPAHVSMFTGQYPLLHQTVQSDRSVPAELPTITEMLRQNGYNTLAFCNNPLVGVLNTGLQRGFQEFFNYASFIPDIVPSPKIAPNPIARSLEGVRGGSRRVFAASRDSLVNQSDFWPCRRNLSSYRSGHDWAVSKATSFAQRETRFVTRAPIMTTNNPFSCSST